MVGIILMPFFAGAATLRDSIGTNSISCSPAVSSVAKNSSISWAVAGLDAYNPVSISWSDASFGASSTAVKASGYSTSGIVNDVFVTLEDASGPLTINCGPLTVQKSLRDSIGTNDISCSPSVSSVAKNSSVAWGITGLTSYNPVLISWSDASLGTSSTAVKASGYSTSGTVGDVSVTLEDASGPLTINCGVLDIKKDEVVLPPTYGGGGGGGLVPQTVGTCSNGKVGDINCDGGIDILDFNLLMVNWGSTIANNVADLNKDGIVDILDFNLLMVNWIG